MMFSPPSDTIVCSFLSSEFDTYEVLSLTLFLRHIRFCIWPLNLHMRFFSRPSTWCQESCHWSLNRSLNIISGIYVTLVFHYRSNAVQTIQHNAPTKPGTSRMGLFWDIRHWNFKCTNIVRRSHLRFWCCCNPWNYTCNRNSLVLIYLLLLCASNNEM